LDHHTFLDAIELLGSTYISITKIEAIRYPFSGSLRSLALTLFNSGT